MERNSYKKAQPKPLEYSHIIEATRDSALYIDRRRKGKIRSLKTPWDKYNKVSMGGIEWRTIHLIAGMSGSGKTAILNQLETELFALNPDENFAVLSFNFEMLARNLVGRKFSNKLEKTVQELYSGVHGQTLSDEDYENVLKVGKEISTLDIHYVENPGSVKQIEDTIMKFRDEPFNEGKGIMVLLDHTLLVSGKSGELERLTLIELMTTFNRLKKFMKISFVILSQLNRYIEDADRITDPSQQFPKKKDLFGGDSVYQFSDMVMISHNPFMMGIEFYGTKQWPTEDCLYWHFLKIREGQPIVARMINNLKFNRVDDYVSPAKRGLYTDLNFDG